MSFGCEDYITTRTQKALKRCSNHNLILRTINKTLKSQAAFIAFHSTIALNNSRKKPNEKHLFSKKLKQTNELCVHGKSTAENHFSLNYLCKDSTSCPKLMFVNI